MSINRNKILLALVVLFFLFPKITAFSFLRLEDLVVICALPVILFGVDYHGLNKLSVPKYMSWYLGYIGIAFVSSYINHQNVGGIGFVFVLRQIQYLVWFIAGTQLAVAIPKKKFISAMSFVAFVLILWCLGELSGAIPKIGKFTGAQERVSLNTSGPFEISVVVVLLMLLVQNRYLITGLIFILLATQARITIVATICAYLLYKQSRSWKAMAAQLALIGILLLALPMLVQNTRLADTLSPTEMYDRFSTMYEASPTITNLGDYRYYGYDVIWKSVDVDSDASFEIRIIRWALIIKSLSVDYTHFLFGWGPGAWGLAVDSHYIRFLGEVGIVGTFFIAMFFYTSLRSTSTSENFKFAIVVLFISSAFIDVMTSSKIMSLFWLISGYTYSRNMALYKLYKTEISDNRCPI